MKITVISGSSRENSKTYKVGLYIKERLMNNAIETLLFDLRKIKLPLWHEDISLSNTDIGSYWQTVSQPLRMADGLIILTPEWDGMVPPVLKNIFNLCCNGEMHHKPALIVSISSAIGGSYPVAELRMSSYKNTKLCYLPEHVIMRNIDAFFSLVNNEIYDERQKEIQRRLHHAIDLLTLYTQYFIPIRNNRLIKDSQSAYGM